MCEKHQQTELNAIQLLIMSSPSSLDILIQLDLHIRKGEAIFYEIVNEIFIIPY